MRKLLSLAALPIARISLLLIVIAIATPRMARYRRFLSALHADPQAFPHQSRFFEVEPKVFGSVGHYMLIALGGSLCGMSSCTGNSQ